MYLPRFSYQSISGCSKYQPASGRRSGHLGSSFSHQRAHTSGLLPSPLPGHTLGSRSWQYPACPEAEEARVEAFVDVWCLSVLSHMPTRCAMSAGEYFCARRAEALPFPIRPFCLDGGAAAWLTVLGAFLALFCSFGQLNSFGTFQAWYAGHQLSHLPPSTISWIGSLQLWVFFFSGAFVGRFFDAYGPRPILLLGSLILVFGTMITSISTQYYQYVLAQGVLVAIGIGMVFYPSLAAISTHFRRYRSTALGIAIAGSGVGGVAYPIIYQQLFNHVGFSWTVRISGFITLALCGIANATITSRLSNPKNDAPWFHLDVFRDTPFRLVILGSIFISFGLFIPSFYIVDYATDLGVSSKAAFYVLSVMNAGGILGRLAPAILADALGRFNILVPCAFLTGLLMLVFWTFARTLAAVMVFAALYGFFSGAFNALVIPCIVQISEPREFGTRIGVLYSIISFPALCGGPVAGAMLKAEGGSYLGMILLGGASVVTGSLFMLWARLVLTRRLRDRV